MKKITKTVLLIISLFTFGSSLSMAEDVSNKKLTLLLWEGSIAPEVESMWLNETGIVLDKVFIDSDNQRDKILYQRKTSSIDIVVIDSASQQELKDNRIISDLSTLKYRSDMDKRWLNACGTHSIPYFWGTVGLVYRKDKFPLPPTSWRSITEPSEDISGHIGLTNSLIETFMPYLLTKGVSIDTEDRETLQTMFKYMSANISDILTFEYPLTFIESSSFANDLYIALSYSGDQYYLSEKGHYEWGYTIPKEGTQLWVDCLTVMEHSQKKKEARQLIEFLSRPDIAAINTLFVEVATPNLSAKKQMPEKVTSDETLYPSQDIINNSTFNISLDHKQNQIRSRMLRSILKQHESK